MSIRNSSDIERRVLLYLNRLRASGSINMFGAITVIEEAFNLPEEHVDKIFWLWTKNFNAEGNYEQVKE